MRSLYIILALCVSLNLVAQDSDFCFSFTEFLKIENQVDIPAITDNGDGTIALTHPDQAITDLFATHTIYDLEQAFPNSGNSELLKLYNLTYGSRALVVDIQTNISQDIYFLESDYTSEFPFIDDFISFIDGKQFIYSGEGETGDGCGDVYTCPLNSVPDDFTLTVLFSYDTNSQTLFLETESPSSCGNEFRIAFKPGFDEMDGGSSEGEIQEWTIDNVVAPPVNSDDPCYYPEVRLYNLLGIGCNADDYYGNISLFYIPGVDKIRFIRETLVFSTSIVEFRDPELGVAENSLSDIVLFQRKGTEQLEIVNTLNQVLSAVIYATNGKVIFDVNAIEDNMINISSLAKNQLYIIELETENKQRKLVKFLKR